MKKEVQSIEEISFERTPFPYICHDNFLSTEECNALIREAVETGGDDKVFMHGGRHSLGSLSPSFNELLATSDIWFRLVERLQSRQTIDPLLNHIRNACSGLYFSDWIGSQDFVISKIPTISEFLPQNFLRKLRAASDRKIRFATKKQMTLGLIAAIVNDVYRVVHGFINFVFGKRVLALLFDYSVAREGYAREVHRDSDARVIVFLLYLNDLESYVEGGSLKLHGSKNQQHNFDPQPIESDNEVVKEFSPKAGRLVMFLNTASSYHSVEKMSRSEYGRHFLYGAYTLTTGFGSLAMLKSSKRLPTEYNLYRE
jgi:hypothetical protein